MVLAQGGVIKMSGFIILRTRIFFPCKGVIDFEVIQQLRSWHGLVLVYINLHPVLDPGKVLVQLHDQ